MRKKSEKKMSREKKSEKKSAVREKKSSSRPYRCIKKLAGNRHHTSISCILFHFFSPIVDLLFSLTHHPRNLIGPRWTLGMRAIENLIDFEHLFSMKKHPRPRSKKWSLEAFNKN